MNFLTNITPRYFLYSAMLYFSIAIALGFWLTNILIPIFIAIAMPFVLLQMIAYLNYKFAEKDTYYSFYFILFAVIISLVNLGYVYMPSYITQKEKLQHTSGIIPQEATLDKGVGKNSRDSKYLEVNDINFNCSENRMDACEKVYDFAGQTATIYYQYGAKTENMVYEIAINGNKIYDFDNQLYQFQKQRYKEVKELAWAILLYLVPSIIFIVIGHYIDVPVITEAQKQLIQRRLQLQKEKANQEGMVLPTLVLLNTLFVFCVWVGAMFFSDSMLMKVGLSVALLASCVFTYFAFKSASYTSEELQELLDE